MPPCSRSTSEQGCSSTGTTLCSPVDGVKWLIVCPLMSSQ